MNYIELINNIWCMREQGIISAHEQDFYMYLLHRCNMLFWKNPFHQSTEVLCSVLSINRNALTARRKRLKQLGLIDFSEGKAKNRPAEYTILSVRNNVPCLAYAEDISILPANTVGKDKAKKYKGGDRQKKTVSFSPPTSIEVEQYCRERDNHVDAHRFVDFYTAKGWMLGKNKMKDWKAAVRTWEKNLKQLDHPAASYKQQNTATDERF